MECVQNCRLSSEFWFRSQYYLPNVVQGGTKSQTRTGSCTVSPKQTDCVGSEALPVLFVPTEIIREIDTGSSKRVWDHSLPRFSACWALSVQTDIRADTDLCSSLKLPEKGAWAPEVNHSNEPRWLVLKDYVFLNIMQIVGCSSWFAKRKIWHQDALWEDGHSFEYNLTQSTYLNMFAENNLKNTTMCLFGHPRSQSDHAYVGCARQRSQIRGGLTLQDHSMSSEPMPQFYPCSAAESRPPLKEIYWSGESLEPLKIFGMNLPSVA